MSLQFIIGGSGSGKTYALYQDIIRQSIENPALHYIIIVPEQFTMQTQKDIVTLHPRHGTMNIDIVSFQRLAYRIFEEQAIDSLAVLDDMGKSMILRKVAAAKKKELGIFASHLSQNGFIGQLKSMLSELTQYGVAKEQLVMLAGETGSNPRLQRKLLDLSVIYEGFGEYIKDKYITMEEILDVLAGAIPKSRIIENSVIALDGYTGFTPIQYRVLGQLLRCARKVAVAITADLRDNPYQVREKHQLFFMSKHTIHKLTELAIQTETPRDKDVLLKDDPAPRFRKAGALQFLERNFERFTNARYAEETSEISLHVALNPEKEVQFAVREIYRLIREEGMRYRDIAIITGDLAGYGRVVSHQLEAEGIPYFLDSKKSIITNPMVEMIRAALELVEKDFSYETVFRYLKTGLVPISREEADRLENYIIALGIRGHKRWSSPWERVYRGGEQLNLVRLNELRDMIYQPLNALREGVRGKEGDVRSKTAAVTAFLEAFETEKQFAAMEQQFTAMGEHSLAKEYSQAYGLVMDLFDRIVLLMGEETMTLKEYRAILDSGFEEIKVGVIPATIDKVVVGNIERTRLNHVRALFFIGVNEGIVPSATDQGGILTDMDKELLEKFHIELAPTAKQNGYTQRFYLYLLLTKPSDHLYVSYAVMDSGGKSRRPSYLIGALREMFPGAAVLDETEAGALTRLVSRKSGMELLIEMLRDYPRLGADDCFYEIFKWYADNEEYRDQVMKLVDAAFYVYQERGIGKAAAKALYGDALTGSVTRLEQYAACAYAHFLTYGLELMERREFELGQVDLGNIFHSAIDRVFKEMNERSLDFHTITEEERKALVADCVQQVAHEYESILSSSARNAYLAGKVERITDRTVWALGEQLKRGDFVPAGFEVSFSSTDSLEALKIGLSEDEVMHLQGRIDRMDLCEDEEHVYVKIIDYKSGGTSFDLVSVYYGLQLQLVVYMDAVLEMQQKKYPGKDVVPAGIFYYNINDPLIEDGQGLNGEELERELLRKLRVNGLVNSSLDAIRHLDREIATESDVIPVVMKKDEVNTGRSSVAGRDRFELLRSYVHERLKGIGQEILKGDVAVNPYKKGQRTACDYCRFKAVCGFDLKTSGYRFRKLKQLDEEAIWNGMEETVETEEEENAYGGQLDPGPEKGH